MWRWVRQGTGQVVEGVQEGRLEDCEGGALVRTGCVQSVFRVRSECVQSVFIVCS